MLTSLSIKNIALIKELDIRFEKGLTVLSGETGAGKSIIIDSLSFLLGGKADKSLIRSGEESACVEGVFCLSKIHSDVIKDLGLSGEPGEEVMLSRSYNIEGRNECRYNGKLITLAMLRNIADYLVDIHGQHEHQALLRTSNHITILDNYGEEEIASIKEKYASTYQEYRKTLSALREFGISDEERERAIDMLSYQISEIEEAKLQDGEEEKLLEERSRIVNAERICTALTTAASSLLGNVGGVENVRAALSAISSILRYDSSLESLQQRLESVSYELDDIASAVRDKMDDYDYNEKDADKIEQRLDKIKSLKKKYGATYKDILKFYDNAVGELQKYRDSSENIETLQKQLSKLLDILYTQAKELSQARRNAAVKLIKEVESELSELGMSGSVFEVRISEFPQKEQLESRLSNNGVDTVEFYLSANAGEEVKPLSKVISGGEMSRFMLALKVITSRIDGIGTMIFDEIDSGISGKIGEVVAKKLARISRLRQVITITHLASVCAMADHNYLIYKEVENDKTYTRLVKLSEEQALEEIARIGGGRDISAVSLQHSLELKKWSNSYKDSL